MQTTDSWAMLEDRPLDLDPTKEIHTDRLNDFYVPLDTKQVISETFPRANLLDWYGKN